MTIENRRVEYPQEKTGKAQWNGQVLPLTMMCENVIVNIYVKTNNIKSGGLW